MITQNLSRDAISEGRALKQLTEIYTEISVQKLQKIRSKIESNRDFIADLAQVFHIIREAALRQGIKVGEKKGNLSILVTSNHPFYGNIETQLTRFFMAHSVLNYGDHIVIGLTGREYLKDFSFTAPTKPMIFHQDIPDLAEITALAALLLPYERVLVYHCKLQSIIVQRPVVTEISGFISAKPQANENFYYILEPETPKMLEFFDTQIVKLLIEQTFLEAELARTGARLILMDESSQKATDFIAAQKHLLGMAQKADQNAKMLEMTLGTMARKHIYAD